MDQRRTPGGVRPHGDRTVNPGRRILMSSLARSPGRCTHGSPKSLARQPHGRLAHAGISPIMQMITPPVDDDAARRKRTASGPLVRTPARPVPAFPSLASAALSFRVSARWKRSAQGVALNLVIVRVNNSEITCIPAAHRTSNPGRAAASARFAFALAKIWRTDAWAQVAGGVQPVYSPPVPAATLLDSWRRDCRGYYQCCVRRRASSSVCG